MNQAKLYITLFVYVQEGEEETFLKYEDQVLPILSRYNAELIYRIRPDKSSFVQEADDYPFEIHLVTFNTSNDFENYRQDKERLSYSSLFQKSVRKVLLLPSQT